MVDYRTYLFPIVLSLLQILFTILFGFHSEYEYFPISNVTDFENPPRGLVEFYYPMFTDIHVMMFIGFGFLMTFLSHYSYSAIGFNFILCAFTVEWALIMRGYVFDWDAVKGRFPIDVQSLSTADFVSASILISMGAVLGQVSPLQLILMAFVEVPLQVVNEWIGTQYFCASDAGESMFVHVFGKTKRSASSSPKLSELTFSRSVLWFGCCFCPISFECRRVAIGKIPLHVRSIFDYWYHVPLLFLAILQRWNRQWCGPASCCHQYIYIDLCIGYRGFSHVHRGPEGQVGYDTYSEFDIGWWSGCRNRGYIQYWFSWCHDHRNTRGNGISIGFSFSSTQITTDACS